MKKIGFLLCAVLALFFVGCGSDDGDKDKFTGVDQPELLGTWEHVSVILDEQYEIEFHIEWTFKTSGNGDANGYAIKDGFTVSLVDENNKSIYPQTFKYDATETKINFTKLPKNFYIDFGDNAKSLTYQITTEKRPDGDSFLSFLEVPNLEFRKVK